MTTHSPNIGMNASTYSHVQTSASLLTLNIVSDRTSLSPRLVAILAMRGQFPAPVKFECAGGALNAWRDADVNSWIKQQRQVRA
jgi:predicted DNA-binding transcriptional regulator AlpA